MPQLSLLLAQREQAVLMMLLLSLFQYCFCCTCMLALIVPPLAGLWAIFTKAGQPGWASIIPIYNIVVLLEIVKKPAWWTILYLIPIVNLFVHFPVSFDLARAFGKSTGFGWGLALLPFVFYPILGFDESRYRPKRLRDYSY